MAADGMLTVLAKPHALKQELVQASFPAGQTLAQVLGADADNLLRVTVNGIDVPQKLWVHLRPRAGTIVYVHMGLQGGNGGKLLRTVALVALAVFAPYVAVGLGLTGLAAAAVTIGVTMIGGLLINALLPPPLPKQPSFNSFQRLNSFTGTGNQAGPYHPIPMVLGEARFFPSHAALPYVEQSGNDQYLRMLLDLGYGNIAISDIQLGSTPITSYTDVEYEVSTTPTLFSDSIFEANVGAVIGIGGNTIRTTTVAADEIGVDIGWPGGLFGVDNHGKSVQPQVTLYVEYSPTGLNTWSSAAIGTNLTISNAACIIGGGAGGGPAGSFVVNGGARSSLSIGLRWKVPSGQYDVRVTYSGVNWYGSAGASAEVGDTLSWGILRSIRYTNPSTTGTLKLALRIKATDQLNQTIGNLSVYAQQLIPVYNTSTSTWSAPQVSTNPGWIYYWLLTACPAFKRLVPASRVDLSGIAAFAATCDAKSLSCQGVLDSTATAFDLMKQVLATGRGSFGMRDGLYSVIQDIAQTTPVQMFTPANSSGFKGTRVFVQLPDALRVRFVNPEANWQDDEVVVYAPGQTVATATKFETLPTKYVADAAAAWRLGSYHVAVGFNRPNTYEFSADIENIVCMRGDLITVAHDVTEWGAGWGRVKSISVVSGTATITLDNEITLAAGQAYSLRSRDSTGGQTLGPITTAAGTTNVLTVTGTFPAMQQGDLCVVGITSSETARLIVTKITPGPDLSAKLTCVDEGPAIYTADSGTPPAFVSQITGQLWEAPPPPPNIVEIFSDQISSLPGDSGSTTPVMHGGFSLPSGRIGIGGLNDLRYRPSLSQL